jgi:uncharacterized RDD family membrane protein YckC
MLSLPEVKIPAKNSRRLFAYLIDSVLASACSWVVWLEALIYQKQTATMGYSLRLILAFGIVYFFYHWLFVYFLGATPGKLCLGLRIISRNKAGEGPAGLGLFQVFLRVLTDQLSLFFGPGLKMLVLMRLDRTHVSDWVAETQVVQLAPRKDAVKRHLVGAFLLCAWFSSVSFLKIYHQFQQISVVGERLFFQPTDNE